MSVARERRLRRRIAQRTVAITDPTLPHELRERAHQRRVGLEVDLLDERERGGEAA